MFKVTSSFTGNIGENYIVALLVYHHFLGKLSLQSAEQY